MDHRRRSTTDHPFRLLTVLAWIPAFALSLPHGVRGHLFPALGILPMTFSACTGLVHLANQAKSRGVNIAMDVFCACFLIAILVPSWITLSSGWEDSGVTVLGTYGTAPMMMNFAFHICFVLHAINWRAIFRQGKTCPHCHGDLTSRRRHGYLRVDGDETPRPEDKGHAHADNGEGVGPMASQDPQPSTDDEAARLV
ncbi:hypothetical protein LTR08_001901 [Meristemomyces frigidus]|nr:hypothetical protein LTR08_001901 [Meristemomyces frigidus]